MTGRRERPGRRVDRELEAGSRAHYEDPAYYDTTYRGRVDDVRYYQALARGGGPVLEYGIGAGRIALPLARDGVEVTGIDQSVAMLRDLRRRLANEAPAVRDRVRVVRGDMRRARVDARFPLVLCTFNTALHLYTRTDVERFLAGVRAHLTPRGRFVVDLSTPHPGDLARSPERPYAAGRSRHPTLGRLVKNREYFDYDRARQILFVTMEFEPVGAPEQTFVTPLAHRQFFPQEWEALLHYNGFEVIGVHGDFEGRPFDRTSETMIWHARLRRGT